MKKIILFTGLPQVTLMVGVGLGQRLRHLGLAEPAYALVATSAALLGVLTFHRFWRRRVLRATIWHGPLILGLLAIALAVMLMASSSLWVGR